MFDITIQGLAHQHSLRVLHKILGHLNVKHVKNLKKLGDGMQVMNSSCDLRCEAYIEGKQARQPFLSNVAKRVANILKILYSDVCSLKNTISIDGTNYF